MAGEIQTPQPAGRLSETIRRAKSVLVAEFTPMDLVQRGQKVTLPLPQDEADELYRALNHHFYAWTGKSLETFKREAQG